MARCEPGCTCAKHAQRGVPKSDEVRRKISEGLRGKPKTDEHKRKLAVARTTHGLSKGPNYTRHRHLMQRCYDPESPGFKYYGARGIGVCDEWHDPAAFCAWIDANLGPCPKGYSLDRINNDGNYEPGNVRWATQSEQNFNRRSWANAGMTHTEEHKRRISEALRRRARAA